MNLKNLRSRVDSLDKRIVGLLNDRAKIAIEIGKIKARRKESVYTPDRESSVYKKIASINPGPLAARSLEAVYREIMSGALALERPLVIGFLGPEFTFSHLASVAKFGESLKYEPCDTIKEVFTSVEKGIADFGVVPIENSIEGAINHTLDMFMSSDLEICGEVYFEISHNMLSKESSLSRIRRIYSNPQVFPQCRAWLEKYLPKAELLDVPSTARGALMAGQTRLSACIASKRAGAHYGLKLLAASIEDNPDNVTRFLIIGKSGANPTGDDKTSVMISIQDKIGGLHDMLVPFKKSGINLTKIESRPSKTRAWEYYFFVDMAGHTKDAKISRAMESLRRRAAFVKILGSYPVGTVARESAD